MRDFPLPDWVVSHFSGNRDQVSHCLNLALPLNDPTTDLPCVLLDIAAAQPQIKRALIELNFLHFARFVPSRSGTHLMVTTEFDGPFEPYVLDFAVCIGDVFNRLLSRCNPKPTLPVGHHPDEFLAFVREWNRVPATPDLLLPPDFDYPVFSAYPQKTVLDIVGPRSALPAPVVDRPAALVELADVQGNILKGYGAGFARHFVVEFTEADKARKWLAKLPVTAASPWGATKPESMLNVGFTFAGVQCLWPGRDAELRCFPQAFQEGPAVRAEANGDTVHSAPGKWLFGGPASAAHAMVSVYAFKQAEWDAAATAIGQQLAPANGLRLLYTHDARALPDNEIPFGYRDGIAEPRIAGQCSKGDDMQPAASPGEFLLGANYVDIYGGKSLGKLPADIAANGSFCAVRLMEQDVAAFEKLIKDAVIAANNPDTTDELVAAKLMGRWLDGTPVALHPTKASWRTRPSADEKRNDFDYAPSYEYPGTPEDHVGTRCPVGAHVRRSNPRSARIAGARHSRRLIRRGLPTAWDESGQRRAGLFGMFLCGSLERQFEFILRHWINGDLAASGIRGTQDPIVGSGSMGGMVCLPGIGKDGRDLELPVGRLTETRASLYLLMPGIAALRSLNAAPLQTAASAPVDAPLDGLAQSVRDGIDGAWDSAMAAAAKLTKPASKLTAAADAKVQSAKAAAATALQPGIAAAIDGALDRALGGFERMVERLRDTLYKPAARPVVTPAATVVPVDPTDPSFIADPYATFQQLRTRAPVQYVAAHRAYWVTSRELVERLCREPALFRQKPLNTMLVGLLTMDDPRHAVVRRALDTAFSNAMKQLPGIAQDVVDQAVAELVRQPHVDLVAGFARRIATQNFMRFFGVPQGERNEIDQLARSVMMHADTTLDTVQQALGWKDGATLALLLGKLLVRAYVEAVAQGALPPTPSTTPFRGNLLQEMALRTQWLPWMPGPMTILESVMTALQFTLAGYLSTEFLLATACRNLLLHRPGQAQRPWDQLVNGRVTVAAALDEARRFDSPLGVIQRHAARDLAPNEFAGFDIPKDALLLGFLGSANRDPGDPGAPGAWPANTDLDTFDVTRTQSKPLLAFGDGVHRCIGAPLQQVVAPMAIEALIAALSTLRLQSPSAVPPWIPNIYFRSFTALPATTCL